MAACKAWFTAKKRVENEHAWKIDFKDLLEKATAEAEPHWQAGREANTRAHKLERQTKETKDELRGNAKDAARQAKLQSQLDEPETAAANERKIQANEQSAGDAIYWPLFNLDHKNPISADALEHRPPGELVSSILNKEREILRLMEEIQTEVEALA